MCDKSKQDPPALQTPDLSHLQIYLAGGEETALEALSSLENLAQALDMRPAELETLFSQTVP